MKYNKGNTYAKGIPIILKKVHVDPTRAQMIKCYSLLPPTYEVRGKVMFSVCPSAGGGWYLMASGPMFFLEGGVPRGLWPQVLFLSLVLSQVLGGGVPAPPHTHSGVASTPNGLFPLHGNGKWKCTRNWTSTKGTMALGFLPYLSLNMVVHL